MRLSIHETKKLELNLEGWEYNCLIDLLRTVKTDSRPMIAHIQLAEAILSALGEKR